MQNKQKDMRELIDMLNHHAYLYYVMDDPEIADADYDELYDQLKKLEAETGITLPDSPTCRVGDGLLPGFTSHRHRAPLWSLDKVQSESDLEAWVKRLEKAVREYNSSAAAKDVLPDPEYVVELKYDGLTVNLTYQAGLLKMAATRGDGTVGEVITKQVRTIRSIPLAIPFQGLLEVQGEGLIKLSVLEKYNELNAEQPLKNARNAAAGALRNLDANETAKRKMDAFCYSVGYCEGQDFTTQIEMLGFLKAQRFPVNSFCHICRDVSGLNGWVRKMQHERFAYDYLTDGLVIKVNDIRTRSILGNTNKAPRWAVAYKFPPEIKQTVLEAVTWNVGRTGRVTPIAVLTPVDIGGTTVSRATLNNWDDIIRKELKLGVMVDLRRANDVIPEIIGAVAAADCSSCEEIIRVSQCPACGAELESEGPNMYCPNSLCCKPQLVARVVHFASKSAFDIENLSIKTVELLFESGLITGIADLFRLDIPALEQLPGFGPKKAGNLIASIEKARRVSFERFLYALGIANVGKKTARDLAAKYKGLAELSQATHEELIQIEDVGGIVAAGIIDFFADPHIRAGVDDLLQSGLIIENPLFDKLHADNLPGPLAGKQFVLTGTLEGMTRDEAEALILLNGGKVVGSVSKKTDYVLAGENPGSKIDKANSLGITILTKQQFLELLT